MGLENRLEQDTQRVNAKSNTMFWGDGVVLIYLFEYFKLWEVHRKSKGDKRVKLVFRERSQVWK
jgi:hypothetical protein